jgi:hypothetical protein
MIIITIGVALALALVVGSLIVADYRLIVRLRRDHRAIWEGIGSPSPLLSRIEEVSAVHRFLSGRHYAVIDDRELVALAERARVLTTAAYIAAAAAFVTLTLAKLND